jgi:hypothetical protein
MKRFTCVCGNLLFFENYACVKCKRTVGWCPTCKQISPLEPAAGGGFTCLNPKCNARLLKCDNYFTHNVCNRCVPAPEKPAAPGAPAPVCDYCRFNHIIPNLEDPKNKDRWARVEAAKRLVLYDFDALGLRYGTAADGVVPPLRFDFKADASLPDSRFRDTPGGEKVFTGHDNGLVTLNLREADPVAREQARVQFGEAHRTLVGHFRHEMGHYVWEVEIRGKQEPAFVKLFGDHNAVPYNDAMTAYYAKGPKAGWLTSYVSGYATMHPWEDWAETFANYLDLMATLETAEHGGLIKLPDRKTFDTLATAYVELGITLNELNRGVGLIDFLPEIIAGPVREKMAFIHGLTRYGR